MEKFGKDVAEQIEWSGTRLICIASDFNKYDEHAVQQINRNIELMRYRFFDKDLLLLELVNAQIGTSDTHQKSSGASLAKAGTKYKEHIHQDKLEEPSSELLKLYESVCEYIDGLGDEVQRKELKRYIAFKRIKNFACIVVYPTPQDSRLQLFLKVNPANFKLEKDFSRDVTDLGHWGTGDLEVTIRSVDDFEKAKPMIDSSYQGG
ncbi:DUF5655 domain-containing protein [Endozoicomonas ascidiicola]|uniref:DUF5655 domain-containing protein n=1 Tax=Endozoicomonas ascidiicola TaxID=1698521 RepID=UPI000A7ECBE7|nr:DUF5655 domain-containing protein [Endozoicomonas ascidiicola]